MVSSRRWAKAGARSKASVAPATAVPRTNCLRVILRMAHLLDRDGRWAAVSVRFPDGSVEPLGRAGVGAGRESEPRDPRAGAASEDVPAPASRVPPRPRVPLPHSRAARDAPPGGAI